MMSSETVGIIWFVLGIIITAGIGTLVGSIDDKRDKYIYNTINKYVTSNPEISAKTTYICLRRRLTGDLIFPDDLIDIKYLKECLNAK